MGQCRWSLPLLRLGNCCYTNRPLGIRTHRHTRSGRIDFTAAIVPTCSPFLRFRRTTPWPASQAVYQITNISGFLLLFACPPAASGLHPLPPNDLKQRRQWSSACDYCSATSNAAVTVFKPEQSTQYSTEKKGSGSGTAVAINIIWNYLIKKATFCCSTTLRAHTYK